METKQSVDLEQIYNMLKSLEISVKKIEQFAEDLEFARRTEEAYRRIELGEYISVDSENLSKEMERW